jgi:hypothetical protein
MIWWRLSVDFKDMKEVRFGQRTEVFRRNNRSDLETLSFSIIYNGKDQPNKSLDLVCKVSIVRLLNDIIDSCLV